MQANRMRMSDFACQSSGGSGLALEINKFDSSTFKYTPGFNYRVTEFYSTILWQHNPVSGQDLISTLSIYKGTLNNCRNQPLLLSYLYCNITIFVA